METATLREEGHGVFKELRQVFNTNKSKDLKWRRQQLKQLLLMCEENHEAMTKAIQDDLGGPKVRATFDFLGVHVQAGLALERLDEWTAPTPVPHPEMLGRSFIRHEPLGVVLVIGPWNFPFLCTLGPLVSIIAAGNCAVIKPSEVGEHSSVLLEKLINKYMDTDCIRVVQGGVAETTALLKEPWDKIMYTGNITVGKIVMAAAAKHLTPVCLELGGKSPVIVDETADIGIAAQRILLSKQINCGQVCIAADYVLVHESRKKELMAKLQEAVVASMGTEHGPANTTDDYGRIINSRHCERLASLVDTTKGTRISPSLAKGEKGIKPEKSYMSITLVDEPEMEDEIMKEEIFGPALPIRSYKTLAEAVETVREVCPQPLALYVFSESQKTIDYVLDNTESGQVCINSVIEQSSNAELPFGGKGTSGMGAYYGKHGFDEFSQPRGVFVKGSTKIYRLPVVPLAPYPAWLYDVVVRVKILGVLPRQLRAISKTHVLLLALAAAVYFLRK